MLIPQEWIEDNTPYNPNDIDMVCDKVKEISAYTHEGKIKYLNIPISFDTETTSFYDENNQKTAIVYIWMLGIAGLVIVGRTLDEWIETYNRLIFNFRTCGNRRIIIYVHNLSFDFQFIRKCHEWEKVFAMGKYDPLYALTIDGIEFRCSYKLSGYSLEKIGQNLTFHHVQKLKGDLDYRQNRHTKTPLTHDELMYCINDAKVVCAYIDELIDRENGINNLPLTKTGFVRRYCRAECFKNKNYRSMVHEMKLSPEHFELCKSAFQGGYTHANSEYVGDIINDVTSLDITSSYPAVMVMEKYPMSTPKEISIESAEQFNYYINNYCCIFTIEFENIRPRFWFDFYLSASKCEIHGKRQLANGRVVNADYLKTTITNVDYQIIEYMYKFGNGGNEKEFHVSNFICFERDYLPTPFVKALLTLYQQKTELKDVEGKEVEYAVIKENQNSFYGMTVTSPIRPLYPYENEWCEPIQPELDNAIEIYNKSYNRFLYYPWGVFVTAYARYNIWCAIIECGHDHKYSDTDSEKCTNYHLHKAWFDDYNKFVEYKLQCACKSHGIDFSICNPKNKKGVHKLLGAFEVDAEYKRFKTLGAKRYLYEYAKGGYGVTVAGMGKKTGLKYMLDTFGDDIFENFKDGLIIPSKYSGRLIHTYIDEMRKGKITDMYGIESEYFSLSSVHLEPAPYTLGLTGDFLRFINDIKEGEIIE